MEQDAARGGVDAGVEGRDLGLEALLAEADDSQHPLPDGHPARVSLRQGELELQGIDLGDVHDRVARRQVLAQAGPPQAEHAREGSAQRRLAEPGLGLLQRAATVVGSGVSSDPTAESVSGSSRGSTFTSCAGTGGREGDPLSESPPHAAGHRKAGSRSKGARSAGTFPAWRLAGPEQARSRSFRCDATESLGGAQSSSRFSLSRKRSKSRAETGGESR